MSFHRAIAVAAAALAGSGGSGLAQSPQSESEVRIDDVVVTASRFEEAARDQPIGIQVIRGEQIRASGVRSIPELLARTAGIYTRDNFGSPNQQIDMRGFGINGDQNTLILVDGQRISENELVPADLASVPLESIERIEILRGSGAVLYGGGATGGTINIITRGAAPGDRTANVKAGYGSYDTQELVAAASIASERAGATFNITRYASDNYRANNRLEQTNFQSDLRYFGNRGPLYLKLNYGDQDLRLPGSRSEQELETDRRGADTPNDFSTLRTLRVNLGTSLTLDFADVAIDLTYRERDAFAFNQPGSSEIKGDQTAISPRARMPFRLGVDHELVTGIDLDRWDYLTSTVFPPFAPSSISSTQTNSALFVKDTMVITPSTRFSVGGRTQRIDTRIEDLTGGTPTEEQIRDLEAWELALRQNLGGALSAFVKTGKSFRVANVDENRFVAEPLEPQTSRDTELGFDLQGVNGWLRASAYYMDIRNELAFLPGDVFPPFGGNVNLSPTRRKGAELEAHWTPASNLILSGQYSYTIAKFREGSFGGVDVSGNNIPLVPRHRAGLSATLLPAAPWRITGTVIYVGEQYYDNDQSNSFGRKIPAYTVVDLTAGYDRGRWTFAAIVRNLFNELYYSYGITNGVTFNAYPAAERSLLVTAAYRF